MELAEETLMEMSPWSVYYQKDRSLVWYIGEVSLKKIIKAHQS